MNTVPDAKELTLDGVSGGIAFSRGSARFETPDLAKAWVITRFGLAVLAALFFIGVAGFFIAEDTQTAVTGVVVLVIGIFAIGGIVGWGFRLRNSAAQPVPLLRADSEPSGGAMTVVDADGLDRTLVTDQASAEFIHAQLRNVDAIAQPVTLGRALLNARTQPFILFALVEGIVLVTWAVVMFVL